MKTKRNKKKVINKQIPTRNSITCGTENPSSLGCEFYELEGGEVGTVFIPKTVHEGHNGIMHGGISGAVLDELMGRATLHSEFGGSREWTPTYVTAEMTVQYKKPIAVGTRLYGYGKVKEAYGRRCFTYSEIVDDTGEIMASATGVYVQVNLPKDNAPEYKKTDGARGELSGSDPAEL